MSKSSFKRAVKKGVFLSGYTTFKIGGPADYFIRINSIKKMQEAVLFALQQNIPFFLLGGGSNLLVDDKGIRGLVIKNVIRGIRRDGLTIYVKSGEKLSNVIDFACKEGLSGLEFAAGIPGTLGGAVYGNAGAYGRSMKDVLLSAKVINRADGVLRQVDNKFFAFKYRWSALKESGDIIVEAALKMESETSPEIIRQKVDEIISERQKKHPHKDLGCAGSYFKNIDPPSPEQWRIPAGKLLEETGAKGLQEGCALVYPGHANFLVNPGNACCSDVLKLAEILKEKVKNQFGIDLEEEVIYVDENLERILRCRKESGTSKTISP